MEEEEFIDWTDWAQEVSDKTQDVLEASGFEDWFTSSIDEHRQGRIFDLQFISEHDFSEEGGFIEIESFEHGLFFRFNSFGGGTEDTEKWFFDLASTHLEDFEVFAQYLGPRTTKYEFHFNRGDEEPLLKFNKIDITILRSHFETQLTVLERKIKEYLSVQEDFLESEDFE